MPPPAPRAVGNLSSRHPLYGLKNNAKIDLAIRSTKGTNASIKTFVLFVPLCGGKSLENKSEGELHLPATLLAGIASEVVRVVQVSIRRRTIHSVQHVIR